MNSDGEGGGEFVQDGNLIKIERVGPLLYFNAPHKFWATHATAAQAKTYTVRIEKEGPGAVHHGV